MSHRVVIHPRVAQRIASWGLPDPVLVEVYLRLREELTAASLRRARQPFDGMLCEFSVIDPGNRLCEHVFSFLVVFSQDEESLIVATGAYVRRVGM